MHQGLGAHWRLQGRQKSDQNNKGAEHLSYGGKQGWLKNLRWCAECCSPHLLTSQPFLLPLLGSEEEKGVEQNRKCGEDEIGGLECLMF